MKVILKNRYTKGQIIQKVGFSWTMFFFGVLVPIFKADWIGALVMVLITIVNQAVSCFRDSSVNRIVVLLLSISVH